MPAPTQGNIFNSNNGSGALFDEDDILNSFGGSGSNYGTNSNSGSAAPMSG